ncbi:MAG TPA: hypothetical protein VK928_09420 [Longimicrobiales bacterium]|nr:hypothetical protein [Longimicrobiales bacterium]
MLDTLTTETFTPRIGEAFRVALDDDRGIGLTLSEVTPLAGATAGRPRTPFSLLFHAPATDPVLEQAIYNVTNENLPALDIFLVPLGTDQVGMRYEAIFT